MALGPLTLTHSLPLSRSLLASLSLSHSTHSLTHSPTHSTPLHSTPLHSTPLHSTPLTFTYSLTLTRSLSLTHSHTPHSHHSLTHSLTHSPVHAHTHTHTNSPTISPPSLSYFLFPCCFSMLSLSIEKLVTCGVIRSYNFVYDSFRTVFCFASIMCSAASGWWGASKS